MAQSVVLAVGTTSATSSDIVVADGAEAVIGIYTEAGTPLRNAGDAFYATVLQTTSGEPNQVAKLDVTQPSMKVRGPNTYTVKRPACSVGVGVFKE